MAATHSVVYRYPVGGITTAAIDANLATFIAMTPNAVLASSLTLDSDGALLLVILYTTA